MKGKVIREDGRGGGEKDVTMLRGIFNIPRSSTPFPNLFEALSPT